VGQLLAILQEAFTLRTVLSTRSLFFIAAFFSAAANGAVGNPAADFYSEQHPGSTPQSAWLWENPDANQKLYHGH